MTKPVLIIQNDVKEGAGLLASLTRERGIQQETVLGNKADYDRISADDYSALVVLGGAQSAYETDIYPFLLREMELCKAFIEDAKPVLGFCLGAQIIAYALGGRVLPGKQKEIGWYDVSLTAAASQDPLFLKHPRTLLAYHFHGDVIEPPPGAINLAFSELTKCQLFKVGYSTYGFQYHAEADLPLIRDMCENNSEYMTSNGFDHAAIVEASKKHIIDFERENMEVLDAWLDLVQTT
jgi:GMP synthase (glutamine-hydrolysing)